uniref:(northern house mosquito) hypothetical protein n=1 Tax=Culex pipiens TaxID=7175 RepID=A0A8D8P159_CULPI
MLSRIKDMRLCSAAAVDSGACYCSAWPSRQPSHLRLGFLDCRTVAIFIAAARFRLLRRLFATAQILERHVQVCCSERRSGFGGVAGPSPDSGLLGSWRRPASSSTNSG